MDHSKAFLRWAGSKRRLLPKLAAYWQPSYCRYFEPFMGSACFFFRIKPSAAVLSDINADLVETFRLVRDRPSDVHTAILQLKPGKESYYKIRAIRPTQLEPVQRAARFIYLNRFCFNGLYRTNQKGEFNVPFSPARTGPLPTLEELRLASLTLGASTLRSGDFENILEEVRAGDFVYLDPPFAVSNRRIFRQYGPSSFGLQDLDRLSQTLDLLDSRGAAFLLSYALCKEALTFFKKWQTRRVTTQRNISGFAEHRRAAVELLVSNRHPMDTEQR
jgi:DNA adenine methylase